ncbi:MAG TPA: CHAD domain-containing protein, partial [Thermomicrobiales bacterium]|nr:CHAD domain-containing protein [Thermomicrobiales bacterium]
MTKTPAPERENHDATYKAAMRQAIAARWADTWRELAKVAKSEDPEAVHATRVASRRLRAAMDAATDAFPRKWYRKLHKMAKTITSELGTVRDTDILLQELQAERARADASEWVGL